MTISKKLLLIASFLPLTSIIHPSSAHAANILLIESYHADYDWDIQYKRALREHLPEHTITTFEMDTKRLPVKMHKQKADEAWEKYNELKPDYVILGDDNALKYLGERLAKTKTPTIFLGINNSPRNYFKNNVVPRHMTGVLERPLFNDSISQIKTLLPDAKKILILFDDSVSSKAAIEKRMIEGTIDRIHVESKLIGDYDEWKKAIQAAKEKQIDAILLGGHHTIFDKNGVHVPAPEALSWANKNSEVPLFTFWSFAVGKGKAIGGVVMDGYEMGKTAAIIAKKVISSEHPRIKVNKEGTTIFSISELKRWNIIVPTSLSEKSAFFE